MRIKKITTRDIGFSRAATPMKDIPVSLVTSASIFEDFDTKPTGWFGPVWSTLVEVEADNGIVGVGTAGAIQGGSKQLIDSYYDDLIMGEDPRRHEFLWQRMYRTTVRFSRSGTAMAAISALDIACWDLHGKLEGKPVHALLGGRTRSCAPCYVSRLYALDD